jgi:hypothetical protein
MEENTSVSVSPELIEKYRDINVDYGDWSDWVIEDFKEDMKAIGIEVDKIYYTGFWSQGDGACFEGNIYAPLFINNFADTDYPMLRMLLDVGGGIYLSVKHSGHYYHENCTSWSYEVDSFEVALSSTNDFQDEVIRSYDQALDLETHEFEKEAIEFMKGKMRELYRRLEEEYNHLTSDESVWEAIIANELHLNTDESEEVEWQQ